MDAPASGGAGDRQEPFPLIPGITSRELRISRPGWLVSASMISVPDDPFSEPRDPARRISQITRRDIFDYIRTEGGPWHGRMDEIGFLGRLYDLEALPSTDSRFRTASGDIFQHRVNNYD